MRTLLSIFAVAAIAMLAAFGTSDAGTAKKKVKIEQQWSGKLGDDALAKLAPKAGYFKDQKAFEELFAAWKLKDKAPAIDFAKQIVFVQLATGGPNVPRSSYTLDEKGDLRVMSISTLIGGPGFGYSIDVLNRVDIKTYQGKAIE